MAFEIGIVEAEDFSEKATEELGKTGRVSSFVPEKQSLEEFIADKHVLFVRLKHYWDKELLKAAKNLRYLCTPTTGLTHIDTDYAESANISIISLKGEAEFLKTISATAEHTLGLAISLLRHYNRSFLRSDNFTWDRDKFKGFELKGMRAGIIGMGRVGVMLSGYLNAFGAWLCYYDIKDNVDNPHNAVRMDSISGLVDAADIVFLCASFEKENTHLIDAGILERMNGKYFINTARGELVDEEALLSLIKKDYFAGVALDVVAGEPGVTRASMFAALADKHNVIITPHIAGATYSSMRATEEFIVSKLVNILHALTAI